MARNTKTTEATEDNVEMNDTEVAEAMDNYEAPEQSEAPDDVEESVTAKKNRLRNKAERLVLNRHRDEFDKVAKELFEENGVEYKPRLSEEQKAEQALEKLLAANPSLRSKFNVQDTNGAE